jgi:hypothetical protein
MKKEIDSVKEFIRISEVGWIEMESKPELFQYNHYMNFLYVVDLEEDSISNSKFLTKTRIANKDIESIINIIASDKFGKVYFVKLEPQSFPMRQYEEPEEYTSKITRYYVPIEVESGSKFCIEDRVLIPEVGKHIEVDPDGLYSIYNEGEVPSIYLVIDKIKD